MLQIASPRQELLYLFPLLLVMVAPAVSVFVLCCVATLSAIEELLIDILSASLNTDRKSIFNIYTK